MRFRVLLLPVFVLFALQYANAQRTLDVEILSVDVSQYPTVKLHIRIQRSGVEHIELSTLSAVATEDGVLYQPEELLCPEETGTRLSIAILLDRSGSMARYADKPEVWDPDSVKMREAKKAIAGFLDFLSPRDEAAIFSFTTTERFSLNLFTVEHDFSNDIESLKGSLIPIAATGGTRMWEAIIDAVGMLRARSGRRVLIVVTDGKNTQGNQFRPLAIRSAVDAGIPVYSIGIGGDVDIAELSMLAAQTGGRFFNAPDVNALESIFAELAFELVTDDCIVWYNSTNPCRDGTERMVELELFGAGKSATDATSYIAPLKLDPLELTVSSPVEVRSGENMSLSIISSEPISTSFPLSYSLTMTYDNQFMQWIAFSTEGSISENLPLVIREDSPGVLTAEMPGAIPAASSGALFNLEFNVGLLLEDADASLEIAQAELHSQCPYVVDAKGVTLRLIACLAEWRIGDAMDIVISDEETVLLPVTVAPLPEVGKPLEFTVDVMYDARLLEYRGVTMNSSAFDGDVLVHGDGDLLTVHASGTVLASEADICYLVFRGFAEPKSRKTTIQYVNPELLSGCVINYRTIEPTIFIDGICEPLVRRIPQPVMSNHPNPFAPSTSVTFTIPEDAHSILRILDREGRYIKTLINSYLPAGDYVHRFDAVDLPAGEYLAVLQTSAGNVVHRLLLVK